MKQMKGKTVAFRIGDACDLALTVAPLALGMMLKILLTPKTEGISITGAQVYLTLRAPLQPWPSPEAQINSWLVMNALTG